MFLAVKLIQNWKIKAVTVIGSLILQIIFASEWHNEAFLLASATHMIIAFLICYILMIDDKVIDQYLTELQDEKYWKKLIDQMQEGIILINKHYQIFYSNIISYNIFGHDQEQDLQAIDFQLDDIKFDLDSDSQRIMVNLNDLKNQTEKVTLPELIKPVGEILKEKRLKIIQGEMVIQNCKNEFMNLDLRITESKILGNTCYTLVCQNKNEKLELIKLKKSNKMKSLMVGAISHDLRSPVNGIILNIDGGLNDKLGVTQAFKEKYLKPAMANCNYLITLINQFLDYTKEKFNQEPKMVLEQINMQDIMVQMDSMFSMRAAYREIDLIFDIDKELPKKFITDSQKLLQILQNILSNAMKFTFKGSIKVKAKLIQVENTEAIQIIVKDTGHGIKNEDQKNVFKLFSVLDETQNINRSGTGIGLYQSQKFAKMLGFSDRQGIVLKSKLGKGSSFSFILENKEFSNYLNQEIIVEEEKEREEEKEEDEINIQNQRNEFSEMECLPFPKKTIKVKKQQCRSKCSKILVVDDEALNIQALTMMLTKKGHKADYTFTGQLAIDMIKKRQLKSCGCKYELVLMDCNMPIMNGYDATKFLKQMVVNGEIDPLIIVAVTADVTDSNKEECEKTGFDEFLSKPIIHAQLDRILQKYSRG